MKTMEDITEHVDLRAEAIAQAARDIKDYARDMSITSLCDIAERIVSIANAIEKDCAQMRALASERKIP